MLPLGVVSGMFMSVWASTQIRPMLSSALAKWAATAETVPIDSEWSPPRTSGSAPPSKLALTMVWERRQTSVISVRYRVLASPGSMVSGADACTVPASRTS